MYNTALMRPNQFVKTAFIVLFAASAIDANPSAFASADSNQLSEKCDDFTVTKLNNNPRFTETYGSLPVREEKFEGVLNFYEKVPPGVVTVVQRELAYHLNGKGIYAPNDDLSRYAGKRVVLIGKNYKFELEGTQRDEIWPVSIVCE